jgi:hypothetical protein
MDLGDMERGGMDWIHLAQNMDQQQDLVNMAMNI